MKQRFKTGDLVQFTDEAAEHYAKQNGADVNEYGLESFTITGVHSTDVGEALYSVKDSDGKPFNVTLYDYDLENA